MSIDGSNMGNMSKEVVIDFFAAVIDDLGVVISFEFTPTSPSIYLAKTPKILFCENDLNGYKWQVKERVLHEVAHHFEKGKRTHGRNFYEEYIKLLKRFMVG